MGYRETVQKMHVRENGLGIKTKPKSIAYDAWAREIFPYPMSHILKEAEARVLQALVVHP
jgi:hypothetical protein